MVITCPTCGHQGKVDPSRIPPQGAKAKCPKCQNGFLIQRPDGQQSGPPPTHPPARDSAGSPPGAPMPPLPTAEPAAQPSQPEQLKPQLPVTPPAEPASSTRVASLGFSVGNQEPAAGIGGLSLRGPSPEEGAVPKDLACTGCLRLFGEDEITRVGERNLCQSCRDAFQAKAQKPSSSGASPAYGLGPKKVRLDFAGFWIRLGAYLIDGILLGLIFWFVLSPIFMKMASGLVSDAALYQDPSTMDPAQMQVIMAGMASKMMKMIWITNLLSMVLMGGYFVVLEGGPGQTLGKKALGLRVVTPDGDRIGYLKAFARYIGRIISGAILGIGFIMAAFDSEKRTLHDRMCDTRVVKV